MNRRKFREKQIDEAVRIIRDRMVPHGFSLVSMYGSKTTNWDSFSRAVRSEYYYILTQGYLRNEQA